MKRFSLFLFLHLMSVSYIFSQSIMIPYYTGFDSDEEKEGWQQFRKGDLVSQSWKYENNSFTAPSSLFHDYNKWGTTDDTVMDWFVSPPINFNSAGGFTFKIKMGGTEIPLPDNLELFCGIGNQDPSIVNFISIANLSNIQPSQQWIDTGINIPFISDSVYIAFRYKNIGTRSVNYSIDNIIINYDTYLSKDEIVRLENTLQIFPNPVNDRVRIVIPYFESDDNISFNLRDIYGRTIRAWSVNYSENLYLYCDGIPSGIYILEGKLGLKSIGYSKLIIE